MSDESTAPLPDESLDVSLEKYLRSMESEELLRLEGDLRELMASPGWTALAKMLAMRARVVKAGTMQITWARLEAGAPLDSQAPLHAAAGRVRGMGEPVLIVDKVLRMAGRVKRELGIDGEG